MNIIKQRKFYFIFSGALFLASVVLLATIGLKPGIDFTGGSLIEISFSDSRPEIHRVESAIAPLDYGEVTIQPADEDAYIFKMRFISEEEHQDFLGILRSEFETEKSVEAAASDVGAGEEAAVATEENRVIEKRVETIGSSISSHLRSKAWYTAVAVVLAIIFYVAYAFRKVSKPVKSWKFGITAIVALMHDVAIVMGVFVLLGHYKGVEINVPFVVALLTILGYSVNDTIVVFDRIRENLITYGYDKFEYVVNKGVNDTLVRSLNTSVTTLIVLGTLFFFGGDTIQYFSLALIIGVIVGTYSSIFLASPILVTWERFGRRK
jgi:preprotein translocase subunit SecF